MNKDIANGVNNDIETPIPSEEYPQYSPTAPLYPSVPLPTGDVADDESKLKSDVNTLLVSLNNHIYGSNLLTTFTVSALLVLSPPPFAYLITLGGYLFITSIFTHFETKKIRDTLR